jgi:hypothetical protein
MEDTIDEIMTGKLSIDQVLQENKEKIQLLTKSLEEIVRKGYFEILQNTEALTALSSLSSDLPVLSLPDDVILPKIEEKTVQITIEDEIWDCLNTQAFIQASMHIKNHGSEEIVLGIKNYVIDPYFYSIFDIEKPLERLEGFCLLLENDIAQSVVSFIVKQLILQLSLTGKYDDCFYKTSDFLETLVKTDCFSLAEVSIESITTTIESLLSPYTEGFKLGIDTQIKSVTEPNKLIEFIPIKQTKFQIPRVWDLSAETWKIQAEALISSHLQFTAFPTLLETINEFNKRTTTIVELFSAIPSDLKETLRPLSESIPIKLFSNIKEYDNPILVLAFIREFSRLPINKCCEGIDLTEFEEKYYAKVVNKLEGKDLMEICHEIREICGDTNLDLEKLEVTVPYCRRGFGKIIGKKTDSEELENLKLPERKPLINKLTLPPRFSQHLILS